MPRRPAAWSAGRAAACSQVEHEPVLRLRAADERAAVGGGLDGVGAVGDLAGNERRLAGMADAGAAGPADGYVTGLGELEEAGVVAAPADGEIAASELDRRAASRSAGGWMGRPHGHRRDAGRLTGHRSKWLGVDAGAVEARRDQSGADLLHEGCRPADVCL